MTFQEINPMIESIGLPSNYYQWPESKAPDLPYNLFYYPERADFFADSINYQKITVLNIEFYSEEKDFENEELIEAVLEQYGLTYSKEEQYIDSERMYEVLYVINVCL